MSDLTPSEPPQARDAVQRLAVQNGGRILSAIRGSRAKPHLQGQLARELPFLLHSMGEFSEIIEQCVQICNPRVIVEIGGEFGGSTAALLASGAEQVFTVDPNPSRELESLAEVEPRLTLVRQPSLECLDQLPAANLYVIDGDHNYATVSAELALIGKLSRHKRHPVVLLHDVLWPCGRRDMYYAPERIADEQLHDFSMDLGPSIWHDDLSADGFVSDGQYGIALAAGGGENGVLTAVEDYLQGETGLELQIVPAVFGLGIVFHSRAPYAKRLRSVIEPLAQSRLLARLELNRLALYTRVLQLQARLDAVDSGSAEVESSAEAELSLVGL